MAARPVLPLTRVVTHQARRWTPVTGLVCVLGVALSLEVLAQATDVAFEVLFRFPAGTMPGSTPGALDSAALLRSVDGSLYGTTPDGGEFGAGTVFRVDAKEGFELRRSFAAGMNPFGGLVETKTGQLCGLAGSGESSAAVVVFTLDSAGAIRPIYSFDRYPAGGRPVSGLTSASDGFLYGVTAGAGTSGSVFQLDLEGHANVLHVLLPNGAEGSQPVGPLVEAADGDLYGVTSSGGAKYAGALFRVTPEGEFTVVHSFDPYTEGRDPSGGLALAPDGELYGALCTSSKSYRNGTVYRLALTGDFTVVHEFAGAEGSCPAGTLSAVNSRPVPGDISLFGIARADGPRGGGTLFQLSLRNGSLTVLHAFGDDLAPPVSVIHGADNALYGMTGGSSVSPRVFFRFRLP